MSLVKCCSKEGRGIGTLQDLVPGKKDHVEDFESCSSLLPCLGLSILSRNSVAFVLCCTHCGIVGGL